MSAWMISNDHADLIATAYVRLIDVTADPQLIGRELLHENMRSLSARYGEQVDWDALEAYRFREWPGEISMGWVNGAAHCADYQACEHAEWRESTSFTRIVALIEASKAGEDDDDAPWGIHPEHRVAAALMVQGVPARPKAPTPDPIDDFNYVGSRHHY